MNCGLSRREMLRFLTVVLPTALFAYRLIDYFDGELVCVHVYGLSQNLPEPLLKRTEKSAKRLKDGSYFHIGLPELIVCRTEKSLLDIFKDPSKPPYLCSYPYRQKGFKKKPPIGEGFKMRAFV
ncbi:MAG: hypothetical protein PVF29_03570 [Desulfobacterales bacterium]|jgi:hypothetical protein